MLPLEAKIHHLLRHKIATDVDDVANNLPNEDRFAVTQTVERMIERGRLQAHTVRQHLIDGVIVNHSWIRAA